MNALIEYFKLIDLLALAALAVFAFAALARGGAGGFWLFVAGIMVAIWGAMRLMGWP